MNSRGGYFQQVDRAIVLTLLDEVDPCTFFRE